MSELNFLDEISLKEIQKFIDRTVKEYYAIRADINFELRNEIFKNNYSWAALCASCSHQSKKKVFAIAELM